MNKEGYYYENHEGFAHIYSFISEGKRGSIQKIVYFQEISPVFYNLAMGDYTENSSQPLDDMNVTDNGDMPKVMTTIVKIIYDFLSKNSQISLILEGNNVTKQKLYQRIIKNNLLELNTLYTIMGFMESGEPEFFDIHNNYIGFLIKLKDSNEN